MKKFSKLLCPFDFSKNAEESLEYAIKLSDNETVITLLHSIQLPYIIDPNGFSYYDIKADEIRKSTEEALDTKIKAIKSIHPSANLNYIIEVDNNPSELILKTQKEGNYDLIIMGSHGRKGLNRLLMGSVAELVLRGSSCPVLVIKDKIDVAKQ